MRTSRSMVQRALVALLVVGVLLAACGGPKPLSESEICGPTGCDSCIGLTCGNTLPDGGVR